MKRGDYIKLTKVEVFQAHPVMLETGYWLKGILNTDLEIGYPIQVLRHIRNGVECPGIFSSSIILKIQDGLIHTENSAWKVEQEDKPD